MHVLSILRAEIEVLALVDNCTDVDKIHLFSRILGIVWRSVGCLEFISLIFFLLKEAKDAVLEILVLFSCDF